MYSFSEFCTILKTMGIHYSHRDYIISERGELMVSGVIVWHHSELSPEFIYGEYLINPDCISINWRSKRYVE